MIRGGAISGIAFALMKAKWRQSMVAAMGVMFGITMFVTLLSFMTGLNMMLDNLILNRTPHIRMFNEMKATVNQPIEKLKPGETHFIHSVRPKSTFSNIRNSGVILRHLEKNKDVLAVAPRLSSQVFYSIGKTNFGGSLQGVDVRKEEEYFHLSDYITKGHLLDLVSVPNSIIVGKGIADLLLVDVGDHIEVKMPDGRVKNMKIVGFFQSGIKDIDKVLSYTHFKSIQTLMDVPSDHFTEIFINLHDRNKAPDLALDFASMFEVDTEDIVKANAQFETGTKIRGIISYSVGITLLIVAGFGIYNILNMLIYEKMDTIAILKAMGYSGADVKRIFSIISVSIGLIGGMVGMIFGFLLSSLIDRVPFNTEALPTIKTFPVNYDPAFYILAFVFSFLTTYWAGLFPSRKASKMDPVGIIRGK
ncbi:MAG: ABC transporter permease [Saprospiraceae bacterium]|nr:ABC transporter permease [Saprospiraceae bacterium]